MSRSIECPIKLALIGTSCTGKTTLLEACRRELSSKPDVRFVDEAARSFFERHIVPETQRFTMQIQRIIQLLALKNEQTAHSSHPSIIICDRSVIDAVVYVRANGDQIGADELLHRVEFWLPTYQTFLLLNPADILYTQDPVRQEDADMRMRIHDQFVAFFEESNLPYELLRGTTEERIKRMMQLLQQA